MRHSGINRDAFLFTENNNRQCALSKTIFLEYDFLISIKIVVKITFIN